MLQMQAIVGQAFENLSKSAPLLISSDHGPMHSSLCILSGKVGVRGMVENSSEA